MENLNIIQLIEENPLTRLSKDYESKFIKKLQEKFTESQQNMFVGSFYCYLNYNSKTDFIIEFDSVWKWLGFTRKEECKRLLTKHFQANENYIIKKVHEENLALKVGGASLLNPKHGGQNKERILMTITTFKKLCLKSNTKKATEIHDYYINLEETLQEITNEESSELRLQLQDQKNITAKLQNNKQLERHNLLLREFGDIGSIVYIVIIKTFEDGSYIVKLGESRRGIKDRYNEHKQKYGEALILDCFIVKKSKDFESFLHNHDDIKMNKVTDLVGHTNEKELFLVGKNLSHQQLLNIIKQNVKYYNDDYQDLEKIKLENKQLEIMQTFNKDNIREFIKITLDNYTKLTNKIDNLENIINTLNNKIETNNIKTVTNFNETLVNLGPRLQKINPETLLLVKVYESATHCLKENTNIKRPTLNKAVINNTVYQGYRWLFVDRNFDPNKISEYIPETKVTKIQNIGYIAKLNQEKTEILNIYLDRKSAAKLNKIYSLDNIVKKCSIINGNYYILYNELSIELKNKYKIPILYKNGVGKYDINNNLIKEFVCKEDTRVKEMISSKTLTKALESNRLYNNFYYKIIGEKLVC